MLVKFINLKLILTLKKFSCTAANAKRRFVEQLYDTI